MSSYREKYSFVKASVDRQMGRELGKWGKVKAFFGGNNFTDQRKQIIDHEFNKTHVSPPVVSSRKRSGSFKASIDLVRTADDVSKGYVNFGYSATHRTVSVDTIVSDVPGGGSKLHQALEQYAGQSTNARRLETATSRPGYFKKMGYDYTKQQHLTNARKYRPTELVAQEKNRGSGGGGFSMEKPL